MFLLRTIASGIVCFCWLLYDFFLFLHVYNKVWAVSEYIDIHRYCHIPYKACRLSLLFRLLPWFCELFHKDYFWLIFQVFIQKCWLRQPWFENINGNIRISCTTISTNCLLSLVFIKDSQNTQSGFKCITSLVWQADKVYHNLQRLYLHVYPWGAGGGGRW